MKPQKKLFRTGIYASKTFAYRWMVLGYCITSSFSTVESDPIVISTMVVDGIPICSLKLVLPGRRSVVVTSPHDVVQT